MYFIVTYNNLYQWNSDLMVTFLLLIVITRIFDFAKYLPNVLQFQTNFCKRCSIFSSKTLFCYSHDRCSMLFDKLVSSCFGYGFCANDDSKEYYLRRSSYFQGWLAIEKKKPIHWLILRNFTSSVKFDFYFLNSRKLISTGPLYS